jgi:hypothetical protein
MKVLAISGHAQNGKDTVADLVKTKLRNDGHKVLITHYADLLKYMCRSFFDWDGNKDEKGRHILQYVGTDIIRKKSPDFWVDFIISVLTNFNEYWDYVIIPDVRFPNELDKLIQHNFDVIHARVVRQNFESSLTEEQKNHPSETALDNVIPDAYINNYGTIDDLTDTAYKFITDYLYTTT